MARQVRRKNSYGSRKGKPENEYFGGIYRGLESAIKILGSGEQLTFDKVKLPEKPKDMTAKEIVALRKKLRVSQRVFAYLLNVSAKTVQAWEHRQNRPSGASLRLLRIVEEHPKVLTKMLR